MENVSIIFLGSELSFNHEAFYNFVVDFTVGMSLCQETFSINHQCILIKYILFQHSRIVQENVVYNSNPKYANATATIFNRGDRSYMNITASNFVDVAKITIAITMLIPMNSADNEFGRVLLSSTINSCKINEGNRGNFIIKMMMEEFDKTADFKWTCPFPKQTYSLYNFSPNDKFLPTFVIKNKTIKFMMLVRFDGKLIDTKTVINLFTFKLYGSITGK